MLTSLFNGTSASWTSFFACVVVDGPSMLLSEKSGTFSSLLASVCMRAGAWDGRGLLQHGPTTGTRDARAHLLDTSPRTWGCCKANDISPDQCTVVESLPTSQLTSATDGYGRLRLMRKKKAILLRPILSIQEMHVRFQNWRVEPAECTFRVPP